MFNISCTNCGEKLWPENPYLGDANRAYAYCECNNCGEEFEIVYELVDLISQ